MKTAEDVEVGVYSLTLNELYESTQKDIGFCIKDIDGDGSQELITFLHPTLTVYTFDGTVKVLGKLELVSGTNRFLAAEGYFCIVNYSVGGGRDHYAYITVKDGNLVEELLFKYNFSGIESVPENEIFTKDKVLCEAAKKAVMQNQDIKFASLKEYVKTLSTDGALSAVPNEEAYNGAISAVLKYAKSGNSLSGALGTETVKGREYYIIKEFENYDTHTATVEWYAVDAVTQRVYILDINSSILLAPDTPIHYREVLGEWYYLSCDLKDGSFVEKTEADKSYLYYPTDDEELRYSWRCMCADAVVPKGQSGEFGYILKDIDRDNTDELFLVDDERTVLAVFTMKNDEAVLLGAYWPRNSCTVTDSNELNVYIGIGTGVTYCVQKLELGEMKTVLEFGERAGEPYKTVNKIRENISSEEYNNLLSDYTHKDGEQWLKTEMHTFG